MLLFLVLGIIFGAITASEQLHEKLFPQAVAEAELGYIFVLLFTQIFVVIVYGVLGGLFISFNRSARKKILILTAFLSFSIFGIYFFAIGPKTVIFQKRNLFSPKISELGGRSKLELTTSENIAGVKFLTPKYLGSFEPLPSAPNYTIKAKCDSIYNLYFSEKIDKQPTLEITQRNGIDPSCLKRQRANTTATIFFPAYTKEQDDETINIAGREAILRRSKGVQNVKNAGELDTIMFIKNGVLVTLNLSGYCNSICESEVLKIAESIDT